MVGACTLMSGQVASFARSVTGVVTAVTVHTDATDAFLVADAGIAVILLGDTDTGLTPVPIAAVRVEATGGSTTVAGALVGTAGAKVGTAADIGSAGRIGALLRNGCQLRRVPRTGVEGVLTTLGQGPDSLAVITAAGAGDLAIYDFRPGAQSSTQSIAVGFGLVEGLGPDASSRGATYPRTAVAEVPTEGFAILRRPDAVAIAVTVERRCQGSVATRLVGADGSARPHSAGTRTVANTVGAASGWVRLTAVALRVGSFFSVVASARPVTGLAGAAFALRVSPGSVVGASPFVSSGVASSAVARAGTVTAIAVHTVVGNALVAHRAGQTVALLRDAGAAGAVVARHTICIAGAGGLASCRTVALVRSARNGTCVDAGSGAVALVFKVQDCCRAELRVTHGSFGPQFAGTGAVARSAEGASPLGHVSSVVLRVFPGRSGLAGPTTRADSARTTLVCGVFAVYNVGAEPNESGIVARLALAHAGAVAADAVNTEPTETLTGAAANITEILLRLAEAVAGIAVVVVHAIDVDGASGLAGRAVKLALEAVARFVTEVQAGACAVAFSSQEEVPGDTVCRGTFGPIREHAAGTRPVAVSIESATGCWHRRAIVHGVRPVAGEDAVVVCTAANLTRQAVVLGVGVGFVQGAGPFGAGHRTRLAAELAGGVTAEAVDTES